MRGMVLTLLCCGGLAITGTTAALLAQPGQGGTPSCLEDVLPVPRACATAAEKGLLTTDDECDNEWETDPALNDLCPQVEAADDGFTSATPQGTGGCAYRYKYPHPTTGECIWSSTQGVVITCKAASGNICSGGGGEA